MAATDRQRLEAALQELARRDLEATQVAAITPPELPPVAIDGDVTERTDAPSRRTRVLAPGEQPSGSEVHDDLAADFSHGSVIPRTRDPLALMEQLVPPDMLKSPDEIREAQKMDEQCKLISEWLDTGAPKSTDVSPEHKPLVKTFNSCIFKMIDDTLYLVDNYAASATDGRPHLRIVLPASMRETFIKGCHDAYAHPGVKRTLRVAAARCWWPSMKKSISEFIGRCPTCLFNKEVPHRGSQHIPDNGLHPWHSVQWDIVHLEKTRSGKEKALVFYDRFTRDVEAFAVMGDCSTDDVLNILFFEIVPRHGWPCVLYSDRGSNLISHKARQFFNKMGIELRDADAHMHTAVAGCERFNATLRELARATHFDTGFEWDLMLPLMVFWYKQLVQGATNNSTFYLNHGREAVSPWDIRNGPKATPATNDEDVKKRFAALHLAWQCATADVAQQEAAQRERHDAKYQTNVSFKVGDRVLVRQAGRKSKMHMPYVGPFRIEKVLDRDCYLLLGRRNARRDHHEFHVSRLKLWPIDADEDDIYLSEEYFDVDFIVDHKKDKKGKMLFRVRWVGYGAADDEWLSLDEMNGPCGRAAWDYMQEHCSEEGASTSEDATPASVSAPPAAAPEAAGPSQIPTSVSAPPGTEEGASEPDARARRLAAREERLGAATDANHKSRILRELQ